MQSSRKSHMCELSITRLLSKERPTRRTNSQNCFRNIRANKNCYRSSFPPRSIPECNNLPDQAGNAASVSSFKSFLTSNVNFEKLLSISHYYDYSVRDFPAQLEPNRVFVSAVSFRFRFRFRPFKDFFNVL